MGITKVSRRQIKDGLLLLGGPSSSTDNAIARFDGTTGKLVQNSGVIIDDAGRVGIGTATFPDLGAYRTPLAISSDQYPFVYLRAAGTPANCGVVLDKTDGTGFLLALNNSGNLRFSPVPSMDQAGISAAKDGVAGLTADAQGFVGIGVATSLTARLNVETVSTTTVGLAIQLAPSQTANAFEVQNSSGTVLTTISKEGWIETPHWKLWNNSGTGTAAELLSKSVSGFYFTAPTGAMRFQVQDVGTIAMTYNPTSLVSQLTLNYGSYEAYIQCHSSGEFRLTCGGGPKVVIIAPANDKEACIFRGAASQANNLTEWRNNSDAVHGTVSENGYYTTRKNAAPADAELVAGEAAYWFDSTNGAAKFMVKAKTADGTVVTGSFNLT